MSVRAWTFAILCFLVMVLVALTAKIVLASDRANTDIQCIHYRNDYRRPAYCDPERQPPPVIVPVVPQQFIVKPQPTIKDFHRRYQTVAPPTK